MSGVHERQSALPEAYHNEKNFCNKQLNAVKKGDFCKLAYSKADDLVGGLISEPHLSLAIETTPRSSGVNDHFINLHYRGPPERHGSAHDSGGNDQYNHYQSRYNLRSIVYPKKNCWFSKDFTQ